ncbi:MAG TPA: hypothetical protein VGJ21_18130 [Terracidiphilus sp.]|jgi:hypothetical protein
MQRSILTCAFLVLSTAAFAQQQSTPSDPYQGQSSPPTDDVIVTTQQDQPQGKPHPGKPLVPQSQPQVQPQPQAQKQTQAQSEAQPQDDAQSQDEAQPAPPPAQPAAAANVPSDNPSPAENPVPSPATADSAANAPDPDVNGTDDGLVGVAKDGAAPGLTPRGSAADPDGDMVNPHPLAPGQLADGTSIRVHLLTRLSSIESQPGEVFRTRVATDVIQDGQVLIPAGSEIDGRVMQVSSGTSRSHGTMWIRPDTLILSNGSRFRLDAQITGTPGEKTHVTGEGFINPGSRRKRDSYEYGGAVGGGLVIGAMVAGPVGAVTGGIIGAGAITVHILTDHSDATLEPGAVMLFTLDNRLDLQAATPTGN